MIVIMSDTECVLPSKCSTTGDTLTVMHTWYRTYGHGNWTIYQSWPMSTKGKGGQMDQDPGDSVPFRNESPSWQPVKPELFIFRATLGLVSFPAICDIAIPGRLIKILRDNYLRTVKIIDQHTTIVSTWRRPIWAKRCACIVVSCMYCNY